MNSQINKTVNAGQETEASMRLVTGLETPNSTDGVFSNKPTAQKLFKNKKILILSGLLLLFVVTFSSYWLLVSRNKAIYTERLQAVVSIAPPDASSGKQAAWASSNIDALKKSNLSNTKNTQELTEYYNRLFSLYPTSNRTQEAKDVYIADIKPRGVLLQVALLEWLLSISSTDDIVFKKLLIADIISSLKKDLASSDIRDKQELESRILYYEQAQKVFQ